MVFAKTSKAAARLSNDVRQRKIKKQYLCIVDGKLNNDKGSLEDYLLKNQQKNTSKVVRKDTKNAKLASLDYQVLKYDAVKDLTLLEVNLHTGRHHQIRVQLANFGHSIFGDQKYGTRGKGKQIALWAYELTIQHPVTKKEMSFILCPEKIGSWKILEGIKLE